MGLTVCYRVSVGRTEKWPRTTENSLFCSACILAESCCPSLCCVALVDITLVDLNFCLLVFFLYEIVLCLPRSWQWCMSLCMWVSLATWFGTAVLCYLPHCYLAKINYLQPLVGPQIFVNVRERETTNKPLIIGCWLGRDNESSFEDLGASTWNLLTPLSSGEFSVFDRMRGYRCGSSNMAHQGGILHCLNLSCLLYTGIWFCRIFTWNQVKSWPVLMTKACSSGGHCWDYYPGFLCHITQFLQLIWRSGTRRWNLQVSDL